jgi:hypothetical protein
MDGDAPAVNPAQTTNSGTPADNTPPAVVPDTTTPVVGTGETSTDVDAGKQAGDGDQTNPDAYADFSLPEGVELNADLLGKAKPLFEKYGITKEDAQTLVDLYAGDVQAGGQRQVDAFNQLMDDWRTQASTDKEFGGDKFNESVKIARSAVDKFGTPELKQLLEDHGVGNHPEVIRFMVRVGKLTREDVPGNHAAPASQAADRISILYPTDKSA